jgi:hypothetical protein
MLNDRRTSICVCSQFNYESKLQVTKKLCSQNTTVVALQGVEQVSEPVKMTGRQTGCTCSFLPKVDKWLFRTKKVQ